MEHHDKEANILSLTFWKKGVVYMKEDINNYALEYSFNKIEETAKTFRRLGETYYESTGISGQLLLVADVLEESALMLICILRIWIRTKLKNWLENVC